MEQFRKKDVENLHIHMYTDSNLWKLPGLVQTTMRLGCTGGHVSVIAPLTPLDSGRKSHMLFQDLVEAVRVPSRNPRGFGTPPMYDDLVESLTNPE